MKDNSAIRVMALGLRGVPNIPGGIETHASGLYPRLAALGLAVEVVGRNPYKPAGELGHWNGVTTTWLPSTQLPGVEAILHTFLGILYAAIKRPDVLHIHAVGPWAMTPLAKFFGLRVVVTHHGQDYFREKWNRPAKSLLRLGEMLGMRFADAVIVISNSLQDLARAHYGRADVKLIPNGVSVLESPAERLVEKFGLEAGRYVVQVSRLVPEKRQLDLISAFRKAALPGWKLLLVGGAQGSQHYAEEVQRCIAGDERVVSTGFLSPAQVQELLRDAGVFALPSSHEGLPIALLEAMAIGTPTVASDIEANKEVGLPAECYFPVGNTDALAQKLSELSRLTAEQRAQGARELNALCSRYDWDNIALATLQVMKQVSAEPFELWRHLRGERATRTL